MELFITAQIASIINGLLLLKSMRTKDKKKFLLFNSASNLFGFMSMVMLGAYAASVGPIVLTVEGLLTHYYETKGKKIPKYLLPLCLGLNIMGGMLTFNSLLSLLPIISSSLASIMIMSKDMEKTRKINLASSLIALPYLITNKAYVAACIFGSSFINTLDAIYRLDIKEKENPPIEIKAEVETQEGEETPTKNKNKIKGVTGTLENTIIEDNYFILEDTPSASEPMRRIRKLKR